MPAALPQSRASSHACGITASLLRRGSSGHNASQQGSRAPAFALALLAAVFDWPFHLG